MNSTQVEQAQRWHRIYNNNFVEINSAMIPHVTNIIFGMKRLMETHHAAAIEYTPDPSCRLRKLMGYVIASGYHAWEDFFNSLRVNNFNSILKYWEKSDIPSGAIAETRPFLSRRVATKVKPPTENKIDVFVKDGMHHIKGDIGGRHINEKIDRLLKGYELEMLRECSCVEDVLAFLKQVKK
jgi:hypothetical protein